MVLREVLAGRAVANAYPFYPEIGLETYCMGQETYSYRGHQVYQHSGGLPGQLSYFMRIPDKGIGIFSEANDDGMGPYIGKVVNYMILDYLLGLPPVDWKERHLAGAIKNAIELHSDEPVPEEPRPAEDISGRYHNAAYGVLDLQQIEGDGVLLKGKTGFFARVNKLFATHIIFTHIDGPIWQWKEGRVYPELHADGSVRGELTSGGSHGTCVFKDGLGFFGDMWGQGAALSTTEPDEENTKESAEIWFEKE